MTTPNPPSGQAIPSEYARDMATGPQHAAPHGFRGDFDRFRADILTEVRAALAPAHIQELATLTRELAAGVREGAEVIAWLGAHGL